MSVSSGLSGRYAKAIYELAEEKKILTKAAVYKKESESKKKK